jgi:transcriptional regulator with GAF, ATPase, and Fis domain
MSPKLEAIAGRLQGATFALSAKTSLGRFPSNAVSIPDSSVAGHHCIIRKCGEKFQLETLGEAGAVVVNGLPIRMCTLQNQDRIRIGGSVFLVLLSETATENLAMNESELPAETTQVFRPEEALALKEAEALEVFSAPAGLARNWNDLLRVCRTVSSIRDVEELERHLLALLAEIVPAERGAILSLGDDGNFTAVTGWDTRAKAERRVEVSREVIDRVLREGVAVLSNGAGGRADGGGAQVQALLAVPLVVFDQVRGVIYMDTCDPAVSFDSGQLRLVAAVGTVAALALESARRLQSVQAENSRLKAQIDIEHDMVGESQRMRQIYQMIAKVGPMDSTTLIYGESGTGKELAARAIHRNSSRASKPFIAINCAAMPETLIESELFGYEKGAFTGAAAQKKGKLEVADGGTVFLDEIGELAPSLQAKLLRVLQERVLDRLGGTHPVPVNIRIVTATNRNLAEAVRQGSFRQDLYYRLNVITMAMPALRDRREDIPALADYFLAKLAPRAGRRVAGISREAQACLMAYDWPGNVRELENTIERAIVLGTNEQVMPEDLPETLLETAAASPVGPYQPGRYHDVLAEAKRRLISQALEQNRGNFTHAARSLGLHRNYLHRLMRNLNMNGESASE